MIQFRKAMLSDLPEMMALFEMGIQSLKTKAHLNGKMAMVPLVKKSKKISINKKSYLLLYDDQIAASAALVKGVDPVYTAIIEGSWSGNGPYASIHRVVVSDHFRGKQLSAHLLKALEEEAVAKRDP